MENNQKYCKHCGELIDIDCIVCPKCGKQVEQLSGEKGSPIIINNSASSSASAAAFVPGNKVRKLPCHGILPGSGFLSLVVSQGEFTGL